MRLLYIIVSYISFLFDFFFCIPPFLKSSIRRSSWLRGSRLIYLRSRPSFLLYMYDYTLGIRRDRWIYLLVETMIEKEEDVRYDCL